jgi:hypothetical protein
MQDVDNSQHGARGWVDDWQMAEGAGAHEAERVGGSLVGRENGRVDGHGGGDRGGTRRIGACDGARHVGRCGDAGESSIGRYDGSGVDRVGLEGVSKVVHRDGVWDRDRTA